MIQELEFWGLRACQNDWTYNSMSLGKQIHRNINNPLSNDQLKQITSFMIKKYESIKGSYELDQDYLAAITVNGIWIKEKLMKKIIL